MYGFGVVGIYWTSHRVKPFVFGSLLIPGINAGVNEEALTAVFHRPCRAHARRSHMACAPDPV